MEGEIIMKMSKGNKRRKVAVEIDPDTVSLIHDNPELMEK